MTSLTINFLNEQAAQLTTLEDWLVFATRLFEQYDCYFGHGCDNAWDEAVFLIFHCLALPLDSEREILNQPVDKAHHDNLITMLYQRIAERKPAAYITGEAWFAGLSFQVDERVLVPRSPLAELIEQQCQPWITAEQVHRILDIGTGSGCIALACAHYFPEAKVDAVDISEDALALAELNRQRHACGQRVRFLQSDCFQALSDGHYDIIISNPPYVDANDYANMPAEYQHEPSLGLQAGEDGCQFADIILAQAYQYLTDHGILIIEVGNSAQALLDKYPRVAFTWLDFARGGDGVLLLTREQLANF